MTRGAVSRSREKYNFQRGCCRGRGNGLTRKTPDEAHIRYPLCFVYSINNPPRNFSGYEPPFCATSSHFGPRGRPDMALNRPHLLLSFFILKMHDRLGNSQTEYRKAHRSLDFQPRAKRRPDIRIWPFRLGETQNSSLPRIWPFRPLSGC